MYGLLADTTLQMVENRYSALISPNRRYLCNFKIKTEILNLICINSFFVKIEDSGRNCNNSQKN